LLALPKPEKVRHGTFSHFIALFCTVAAKRGNARGLAPDFCNEIKDLERILTRINAKKPFQKNDLAEALHVKPQQKLRC